MKLSAILDWTAQDHKAASDGGIRQPRNGDEAYVRVCKGMREMKSRNDEAAFRIFDTLSRYKGDAPPQLVATAKVGRDFLDPERTAEQKAKALFDFFSPTLIRVFPDDEG